MKRENAPGPLQALWPGFGQALGEELEKARQGMRAGDAKAVAEAAHAVKGACQLFGQAPQAVLAGQAEERALQGDAGLAVADLEALVAGFINDG